MEDKNHELSVLYIFLEVEKYEIRCLEFSNKYDAYLFSVF